MALNVVILAAGKGTRMHSTLPKALHPIAHKSMVKHVIDAAKSLGAETINVVYGFGGDMLRQQIVDPDIHWVEQQEQLGTGHAVAQAIPHIHDNDEVLILYADVPLIRVETLKNLLLVKPDEGIGLLTVKLPNPTGYGRIIRHSGSIVGIVEHKDASDEQREINEVNTGILVADGDKLKHYLANLSNDNAQGEYYLTDVIAMCHAQGHQIKSAHPVNSLEVEGANNRVQLAQLEREYQHRQAEILMTEGVSLRDPARIDVRGEVSVGRDIEIDVNVVLQGEVKIGNNVKIGANCVITDTIIGDNAVIKPNSVLEGAVVGSHCAVGPFARLRPGAELRQGAAVGNFVEMKKSILGEGAKAGHLTYLGDAEIGAGANIGAGTITCNYDGVNKSKTIIGEGAFIGSNSSLVAPVKIGKGATVGAGSTITKTVEDEVLAIGRGKQVNLTGWKKPVKRS